MTKQNIAKWILGAVFMFILFNWSQNGRYQLMSSTDDAIWKINTTNGSLWECKTYCLQVY